MAIQNLRPPASAGFMMPGQAGVPSVGGLQINGAGEGIAFCFVVPKSGDITGVVIACSEAATPQDVVVTLETVGTDFQPTGTAYKGSAGGALTPSVGIHAVTLGTQATSVVAGDIICAKVTWSSTAGDIKISTLTGTSSSLYFWPLVLHNSAGSTYARTAGAPCITLAYGDSTHEVPTGCAPPVTAAGVSIDNASSPAEVGFWINSPCPLQIGGLTSAVREFGSTELATVTLYSDPLGTPTQIAQFSASHDVMGPVIANGTATWPIAPQSLAANTDYVLAIANPNTANDITCYVLSTSSANYFGSSNSLAYASRSSGAFTKDATKILYGRVEITGIDDGAGSGGGSFPRVQLDGVLG